MLCRISDGFQDVRYSTRAWLLAFFQLLDEQSVNLLGKDAILSFSLLKLSYLSPQIFFAVLFSFTWPGFQTWSLVTN